MGQKQDQPSAGVAGGREREARTVNEWVAVAAAVLDFAISAALVRRVNGKAFSREGGVG